VLNIRYVPRYLIVISGRELLDFLAKYPEIKTKAGIWNA
jgi:hypothetical protein